MRTCAVIALEAPRAAWEQLLGMRQSPWFLHDAQGRPTIWPSACKSVSKRDQQKRLGRSAYDRARSSGWIKLETHRLPDFMIIGYAADQGLIMTPLRRAISLWP